MSDEYRACGYCGGDSLACSCSALRAELADLRSQLALAIAQKREAEEQRDEWDRWLAERGKLLEKVIGQRDAALEKLRDAEQRAERDRTALELIDRYPTWSVEIADLVLRGVAPPASMAEELSALASPATKGEAK